MTTLNILKQPLSKEEMIQMMENNHQIEAIVPVPLSNIIDGNFEDFLDEISELATGSTLLMGIGYEVVGAVDIKTIAIKVVGDASSIIDWEDIEE